MLLGCTVVRGTLFLVFFCFLLHGSNCIPSLPSFKGNAAKASEILAELDKAVPGIIMVKLKRINLERRRGNFEGTSSLYEEAMNETSDQELATFFAIRYSRFLSKVGSKS